MEKPIYQIQSSQDGLYYTFTSQSDEKTIKKFVAYVPDEYFQDRFHLLFGDMTDETNFDVFAVSNNNDMVMVLSTIIKTLFEFFDRNPEKSVFFTGSTLSRTRLYRAVIGKLMKNVELYYEIMGMTDNESFEPFDHTKSYKAYLINKRL